MSSREICIWVDERWYSALNKHLKDETLEEHLENVVDELCSQLPEQEYSRISEAIWKEQQELKQQQEASRRFAVFHVTEHSSSVYFTAEENLEVLQAATRLRAYIRKAPENMPPRFTGMFSRGAPISREQFNAFVSERLENTGRVTGAYHIDLDKGRFDTLHIMDGWQCFRIQDICSAAYFAGKKSFASQEERWRVFLDRLDGKQLTQETEPGYLSGSRPLRREEISFEEEIQQNENLLEFELDVFFDADQVFGTNVCTTENDDWVNVYANYDLETGSVCGTLDVYLVHGNGAEQDFLYRLSEEEQSYLLPKMEDYCQQQWGKSLEECRAIYRQEQQQEQQGPTLSM